MTRSVNRVTASLLAVLLVISLVFAPAVTARADAVDASSINLTVQADGITYSVELCFADTLFALLASMEQMDSTIALNTYLGECGLVLECDPFLPQAYGIDIAHLQENLPNSIFAPGSGSAYALPQEIYDALTGEMPVASIGPNIDPTILENAAEVLIPHLDAALQALTENLQMSVSPSVIPMESGDRKVTQAAVTVTAETLAETVSAFAESIREDAAAKEAFAQIYDAVVSSGVAVSAELEGVSGAQLMDILWENMDDVTQGFTSALIENNLSVTVNLATDKETHEPVSAGFVIYVADSCLGLSLLKGDSFLDVQLLADGETMDILFCLDSMTDSAFAASIHVALNGEEQMKLTFTLDMDAGKYLGTIEADGEVLSAGGSILQGNEGQSIITLDTLNGEPAPFQATLTVNPDDIIFVPSYQDIVTMSEEDFSALASIFSAISQIASSMMEVG